MFCCWFCRYSNHLDECPCTDLLSECLFLLVAYPVCVLQMTNGNFRLPDVVNFCKVQAEALHSQLRLETHPLASGDLRNGKVFQRFSEQLTKECEKRRYAKQPKMDSSYDVYSALKTHVKTMSKWQHLDADTNGFIRK